ncbi:hypothetical protein Clacol_008262 [Clathrus columnatus]|uniref:Mur ligase central domain-containing protein n=1 Tax=Clathrus columnatus TaxID=1419009 RepID=A0AAV5AQ32_9AGAM|nr:hypothetical protein Clacol_008262 [Clathrus columnatus]
MSIDLSLTRIRRLFSLLPLYRRPTIHVAGTNGKGSVTAILSSIFTASHISVGRFNSPHLIHVWDSICINDRIIPEEMYRSIRKEVERVNAYHLVEATNFEILTATAAQIFEQSSVDIAIFEVGLGGKHDATNALPDDVIIASAITSIDLDHQQFLGNTISSIAKEKAGIARKGRPCILGYQNHSEVANVVNNAVQSVGGHLYPALKVKPHPNSPSNGSDYQIVSVLFHPWGVELELKFPLLGSHQLENLGTALSVLGIIMKENSNTQVGTVLDRVSPSTLCSGVLEAKWAGRLERIFLNDPYVSVLVDGAHNSASATALQEYLMKITPTHKTGILQSHSEREHRTFIIGLSHSPMKQPAATLSPLLRPGDKVAVVLFNDVEDMPWVKNVPPKEVVNVVRDLTNDGEVEVFDETPSDQLHLDRLKRALYWAADRVQENEEIVLCGSLYLVADFYKLALQQGYVHK